MSLLDREWFVEDHKRREEEYGGDFSLHSKKVSNNDAKGKVRYEMNPIEQELNRIRKDRADKNKAAIVFGILSLIYVAFCFFTGMSPGTWLPIIASIINLSMFALAHNRMEKEGDKTGLNKWARILTITATAAMLLVDRL